MSVTNRKVDILLNCKGYSCYYGLFVESKSGFEVFGIGTSHCDIIQSFVTTNIHTSSLHILHPKPYYHQLEQGRRMKDQQICNPYPRHEYPSYSLQLVRNQIH